ncbi:MAG: TOBE domain-containing protein [Halobacteria archaeon]|nr:TOBE domain-containing protein [Halobacteria archaeon]
MSLDTRGSHDTLASYVDQPVFIGLRPEAFEIASSGEAQLALTLTAVEALGHEQLLYFDVSQFTGSNMIVRVQGSPEIAIGDKIPLRIQARELYFFNAQGEAIY